jgi:hypothetical protein
MLGAGAVTPFRRSDSRFVLQGAHRKHFRVGGDFY